ncbi:hypothetical protein PsorP6_001768 [Peronosclerospora sorghi]|uniref:Uncharacterized protein n=1 Tax=Peronosclerospora sorghi TaxID=230839 RepID=A0ACC0WTE8_9STRA|nr:hypothetical protein PsorP6_001768 [Peronosclerospora sorghi]
MQQWSEVQQQGRLLDDLESLQKLLGVYPDDTSVFKLHVVDGAVVLAASSWNNISVLTVNTNGIKENYHLFASAFSTSTQWNVYKKPSSVTRPSITPSSSTSTPALKTKFS